MTLHIFNPEHDIALAQNNSNYTPSNAVLQIRNDLAFIPYIWANQGDLILVNDVMMANKSVEVLRLKKKEIHFIDINTLDQLLNKIDAIQPWGWDCTVKEQLRRLGISPMLLPSDVQLSKIRYLNNRKTSINWLSNLKTLLPKDTVVGESYFFNNISIIYFSQFL